MHRLFMPGVRGLIVASVVGVALPGGVAAQELGLVYANVMSQTGQPITDLTLEEFAIQEDETEVKIVSAEIGTAPMKIAILVDNGADVDAALTSVRNGLAAFLETLPPQHVVSLYTIGGQIQRLVDFTTDRAELTTAARSIFPDSNATVRVLDGLRDTWERRFEGDESWPVFVMVLTDGAESSAYMSDDRYREFVNTLLRGGVTVHALLLSSSGGSRLTNVAISLTGVTGGRFSAIAAATRVGDELKILATDMGTHFDEVSNRYRLIYERPDPPGARISVSVTRPGTRLQLFADRQMP